MRSPIFRENVVQLPTLRPPMIWGHARKLKSGVSRCEGNFWAQDNLFTLNLQSWFSSPDWRSPKLAAIWSQRCEKGFKIGLLHPSFQTGKVEFRVLLGPAGFCPPKANQFRWWHFDIEPVSCRVIFKLMSRETALLGPTCKSEMPLIAKTTKSGCPSRRIS